MAVHDPRRTRSGPTIIEISFRKASLKIFSPMAKIGDRYSEHNPQNKAP